MLLVKDKDDDEDEDELFSILLFIDWWSDVTIGIFGNVCFIELCDSKITGLIILSFESSDTCLGLSTCTDTVGIDALLSDLLFKLSNAYSEWDEVESRCKFVGGVGKGGLLDGVDGKGLILIYLLKKFFSLFYFVSNLV